ncbi:MAG: TOBE domain-containing protein, partial [Desulfofustis sp.]|nr:TOBE domain-containing protein [Desulfofustis sp.]
LVQVDGELIIDSGSFQVKVPQQYYDAYGNYKDKEVTFGVRPEDITDSLPVNSRGQWEKLVAKVRLVEPLGAEIILELESGQHRFTARVDPQSKSRSKEEVEVSFDMRKMHLFDAETGKVISRN